MPGLLAPTWQLAELSKPAMQVISIELSSDDEEATTSWFSETEPAFNEMLAFAEYPFAQRNFYLDFYRRLICPAMGSAPSECAMRYRGCLTTDGTPVEFSFSWDSGCVASPDVRFSIDPDATSGVFASVERTRSLLSRLQDLPACRDLDVMSWGETLFDHFALPSNIDVGDMEDTLVRAGHNSLAMLGFDLSHDSNAIGTKIYFLPCLKAAFVGTTRWQVVYGAMMRLATISDAPVRDTLVPQINMLQQHIANYPHSLESNVRYLSVDLVKPEQARMKVYVRAPGECFEDIWDFFTMDGRIPYSARDKLAIEELYAYVQGTQIRPTDEARPRSRQQEEDGTPATQERLQQKTAPFRKSHICYFSLANGQRTPRSKLFIRAQKPFAQSDSAVAQGLEAWFRRWQWLPQNVSWRYNRTLAAAFPRHDLENDGMHCWVSISIKKGTLTVESYLSPQVYKQQFG